MEVWTLHPPSDGSAYPTCRDAQGAQRAEVDTANIFEADKETRNSPQPIPCFRSSGWIQDEDNEPNRVATWSADAWGRLTEIAHNATQELWLRPASRHVLSDVQRCRKFLADLPAHAPVKLVLDPAALLEASMLETAEDHLARILDTLLDEPRVGALLLTDLAGSEDTSPWAPLPEPRPIGQGVLPVEPLRAACRWWAPTGKPLVLLPDEQTSGSESQRGPQDSPERGTTRAQRALLGI